MSSSFPMTEPRLDQVQAYPCTTRKEAQITSSSGLLIGWILPLVGVTSCAQNGPQKLLSS